MREAAFIRQNKEKWIDFETKLLGNSKTNPDDLSKLYIHLMNDLAYAQTFYPKSKTTFYLNNLAAKTYLKIYRNKKIEKNRLIHFFKTEVPLLVHQYRKYLAFTFILFFAFVAIGVISARNDDGFVRLILGDYYVNLTLENIEKGDPMAIYKSGSTWGSHIGITIHNLQVGIYNYVLGIFAGVGTLFILFKNSIMLGAFQYFFYQHGVFLESVRSIWIHGAMEIFAIVIEAMAGFVLGASFLFPGTYSRIISFKIGAINSLKILISTFPFTIAAGFLEGYITRLSGAMPNWISVFIIISTLSIISFYYIIYPFIVKRKLTQYAETTQKTQF
ncbi:MAG: stage II sporulation protein M [Bacteroidales bacterium]|nr:stage II sporulation protein M [Bacteroidales bacterium]